MRSEPTSCKQSTTGKEKKAKKKLKKERNEDGKKEGKKEKEREKRLRAKRAQVEPERGRGPARAETWAEQSLESLEGL